MDTVKLQKDCEIHIEMLLDKDEQTRIGINSDDVPHVRPLQQKLLRILEAYNERCDRLDAAEQKIKELEMEKEKLKEFIQKED